MRTSAGTSESIAETIRDDRTTAPWSTPEDSSTHLEDIARAIGANLPQATTLVAAIIAAIVTFTSFAFNYRATLQNQRDTQFFEALKRFGDTSASLRNSAAGLLVQMAGNGSDRWWYDFERRLPYFTTAVNQLVAGMALEQEGVVATTIVQGLRQLMPLAPYAISSAVKDCNVAFQAQLIRALAVYCACDGHVSREAAGDAIALVAPTTPYDARVLQNLTARSDRKRSNYEIELIARPPSFTTALTNAQLDLQSLTDEERAVRRRAALATIAFASERLGTTADLLVRAALLVLPAGMRYMRTDERGQRTATADPSSSAMVRPVDLAGAFLANVDLSRRDLRAVNFNEALLDGANLSGSDVVGYFARASLNRANLQESHVDLSKLIGASMEETRVFGALLELRHPLFSVPWYQANFYSEFNDILDTQSLRTLFGEDLAQQLREFDGDPVQFLRWRTASITISKVHPSVLDYIGRNADPPGITIVYDSPLLPRVSSPVVPGAARSAAANAARAVVHDWKYAAVFALSLAVGTAFWVRGARTDVEFFACVAIGCGAVVAWLRMRFGNWRRERFAMLLRAAEKRPKFPAFVYRALGGYGAATGPRMSGVVFFLIAGTSLTAWYGARYRADPGILLLAPCAFGLCLVMQAILNMRERAGRTRYPLH